jgi:ADP-heptose:LPS heptosyltransferase
MLNDTQIGDIWVLFSEFIDKKQLEAVAERYVELLADFGTPDKTMQHSMGVDPILDQAFEYYLDEPDEDDDVDELDFE